MRLLSSRESKHRRGRARYRGSTPDACRPPATDRPPTKILAAALAATLLACGAPDAAPTSDAVQVTALLRSRLAASTDTIGPYFVAPFVMTRWKDSIVVADLRTNRLAVLPRSLEGGRSMGSPGEGPGELRRPQGLTTLGDTLVVFERGNGRVAWFGPAGEFLDVRTLFIPSLKPSFAALEGRRIVYPTGSADSYAAVDSAGTPTPWLERPEGADPLDAMPVTSNEVIRSAGQTWLVDMENGLVARRGSDGHTMVDSLPAATLAAARHAVDSLAAGYDEGEVRITPIVAAGPAPDGIVVWLIGSTDPAGAILRPSGEWTPIRLSGALQFAGAFPGNPGDVFIWDDELFVLATDGLRVYELARGGL